MAIFLPACGGLALSPQPEISSTPTQKTTSAEVTIDLQKTTDKTNNEILTNTKALTSINQPAYQPFLDPMTQPKVYTDLWLKTVDNYGIEDQIHPRITPYIKKYGDGFSYMERITRRATPFYHYVLNRVLEEGMPAEFALLPIIESHYDTYGYSHQNASGAWQFIPSTGKMFGLKQTWWYDGRRDIVASTNAAIKYLKQLHATYDNDWLLALAAYNCGPGTLRKAIRANKKVGKPTDFWSLSLPKETMHYIPKFLGIRHFVKTYAGTKYLTSIPNRPYFSVVDTGSQLDLAHSAELAGVDIEEIYKLNSGFNRWATDPHGPHYLFVPVAQVDRFKQRLQEIPFNQRISWQRYIIQPGDSLLKLSRQFKVSVAMIQSLNKLESTTIYAGENLLIPVASDGALAFSMSNSEMVTRLQNLPATRSTKVAVKHRVKSGESLWTISRKYQVRVKDISYWNQISSSSVLPIGKVLKIWQ